MNLLQVLVIFVSLLAAATHAAGRSVIRRAMVRSAHTLLALVALVFAFATAAAAQPDERLGKARTLQQEATQDFRAGRIREGVPKAREALAGRGVEVSEVDEHPRGIKYVYFSDPDGNSWLLQEIPANL